MRGEDARPIRDFAFPTLFNPLILNSNISCEKTSQSYIHIRCSNKFLFLHDNWWPNSNCFAVRGAKQRSFISKKSRDERSKSFQSYATISTDMLWEKRHSPFTFSSSGNQLLKRFVGEKAVCLQNVRKMVRKIMNFNSTMHREQLGNLVILIHMIKSWILKKKKKGGEKELVCTP